MLAWHWFDVRACVAAAPPDLACCAGPLECRVQPLTSIHHPSCLPERCVEMGCEIPNCRGNTCLRGADGKWTIRLVHHKTTG